MEFTFGICTYNSKDFIIETLESIKYQVQKYGKYIATYIVISDDASDDNTIELVEKWLDYNKDLFSGISVLKHLENRGISFNYCDLLRNINTEYFIKIDGDDLFASGNIYEKCFEGNKDECRIFVPAKVQKKGVYFDESDLENIYYYANKKRNHKKDLHIFETLKPFMTNQVVITKSNFGNDCLEYIEEFPRFEDDPSIYYAFKSNENMIMNYILEPCVLYRINESSVIHNEESINRIKFLDDLYRFKKNMLHYSTNIGAKIVLLTAVWDAFLMKHRFDAQHCLHRKIRSHIFRKQKICVNKDKNYILIKDKFKEEIIKENEYLKNVKEKSEGFIECINDNL